MEGLENKTLDELVQTIQHSEKPAQDYFWVFQNRRAKSWYITVLNHLSSDLIGQIVGQLPEVQGPPQRLTRCQQVCSRQYQLRRKNQQNKEGENQQHLPLFNQKNQRQLNTSTDQKRKFERQKRQPINEGDINGLGKLVTVLNGINQKIDSVSKENSIIISQLQKIVGAIGNPHQQRLENEGEQNNRDVIIEATGLYKYTEEFAKYYFLRAKAYAEQDTPLKRLIIFVTVVIGLLSFLFAGIFLCVSNQTNLKNLKDLNDVQNGLNYNATQFSNFLTSYEKCNTTSNSTSNSTQNIKCYPLDANFTQISFIAQQSLTYFPPSAGLVNYDSQILSNTIQFWVVIFFSGIVFLLTACYSWSCCCWRKQKQKSDPIPRRIRGEAPA